MTLLHAPLQIWPTLKTCNEEGHPTANAGSTPELGRTA